MEREELLATFEKEVENINAVNAKKETEMLKDFENKLKELEKEHKQKLSEKEKQQEVNITIRLIYDKNGGNCSF